MATNDVLLLDGLIDDLLDQEPDGDRGRVFEMFALSQILKDWDFDLDEINAGWTDGRRDGGIDGFYVVVNGHCIRDIAEFVWPKVSADIVVHIVTCKHADTFAQAPLDALIASLTELLDFSIEDRDLKGAYSAILRTCRARLFVAYRRLASRLASFKVIFSYASRGNVAGGIGEEVESRSEQIVALAHSCFNRASVKFEFIGATELVELNRRRPKFELDMSFCASLSSSGSNFILLVPLIDYYKFCSDDAGKLRRYLFESNVRDFMGLNRVNEDISMTLLDQGAPDFWWLNNGVTILATSAFSSGNALHMEGVQIVNGLQTTESIYRYFASRESGSADAVTQIRDAQRSVMVKVISSSDEEARDRIVRATNNQTAVEQISLHATKKGQRDIEECLLRAGLYYERRKNSWFNQGVPRGAIVSPMYLAAGILALGRKRQPWSAVALKQRHLNDPSLYEEIFGERLNLQTLAPIILALRAADQVLEEMRPRQASEGLLRKNRYSLALLSVARTFGTFNYGDRQLAGLVVDEKFTDSVRDALRAISASGGIAGRRKASVVSAYAKLAAEFSIAGVERISRAESSVSEIDNPRKTAKAAANVAAQVSNELLSSIKAALPPQPWKPGLHERVCATVGCTRKQYFNVVESLIQSGELLRQKDGVLYGLDGVVKGFDADRVYVNDAGQYVLRPLVSEHHQED